MPLELQSAPVQPLHHPLFNEAGVKVMMKREDLIHPQVSGNKWRKLKYNFEEAESRGIHTILTFGGAYSNHLVAVAVACHALGFESVGVVRGEQTAPLNATLAEARRHGMQLRFVSRSQYRGRDSNGLLEQLAREFPGCKVIPEGGANGAGVRGCREILAYVDDEFDVVTAACGTGTTLAGLVMSLHAGQEAIGFPALKGGDYLRAEVLRLMEESGMGKDTARLEKAFRMESGYHFGGYARMKPELAAFMESFYADHKIKLDPVYTAKMAFGVYDLIKSGVFKRGTRILMIHTGGLQGLRGFDERFGMKFYTNS
jgi:1-aminocyclopropane-1-carboxylate deaminase/D-cysteine desulfhydrase-like pyridoxal-dependent ACC family enzyme